MGFNPNFTYIQTEDPANGTFHVGGIVFYYIRWAYLVFRN
jgi:hypothetical protein